MKQYPLGYFSIVCIFTLIGTHCFIGNAHWTSFLGYVLSTIIFVKICKINVFSYRFLSSLFFSFICVIFMLQKLDLPTKGQWIKGTFHFNKIFRTNSNRIGGIGMLTSKGKRYPIYIHASTTPKTPNLDLNNTYYFSGYVKPLTNPFLTSKNFSFYLWSRQIRFHTTHVYLKTYPQNQLTFIQHCRTSFYNALTTNNERHSHIFRAILMGKKEDLSKDQIQHFFYTGTMHLFAVSGLHVGVVSTFLFFFCKLLFLPKYLRLILTGIGVCFYASIVGFSPSTLRATLMVLFVLFAQLFSRPADIKGALFNTIGLTIFFNPFEFWDVGFQLSYGVVACILCVGIPVTAMLKKANYNPKSWKDNCIISCFASLMSCLFSIYYWGIFSPWIFLANLFLIPIASLIVVLGVITWGCYFLPPFHQFFITLSAFCIQLLIKSVEWIEQLPGLFRNLSLPSSIFLIILFLFFIFITHSRIPFLNHSNR